MLSDDILSFWVCGPAKLIDYKRIIIYYSQGISSQAITVCLVVTPCQGVWKLVAHALDNPGTLGDGVIVMEGKSPCLR